MRFDDRLEFLRVHPQYQNTIPKMVYFLFLIAVIQLAAWQLPTWPEFKGIPFYLPLHTFLECVSIVVSMMVFAVGWNSRSHALSGNVILLACVFFSVGLLDFSHTVSYGGMPDFISPNDVQKHLNFWLSARLFAAVVLLVVAVRPWKPLVSVITHYLIFGSLLGVTILINWVVINHQVWLPDTFIQGQGLTPFKKNVEYFIIVVNLITAAILWAKIRKLQTFNVVLLFGATCTLAMSEFFFTLYTTMTGSYNVLGHIYKVIAYLIIYRAIVVEVIEEPYNLLEVAKNKFQESETRFRHILEHAPIGIVTNNLDGHFIKVNEAFCKMLGYEREELEKLSFQDVTHPDDKTLSLPDRQKLLDGEIDSYKLEKRYIHKDGKIVWGQLTSSVEKGIQGAPFFIAQVEDITERKLTETALLESEQKWRFALDGSGEGVWERNLQNNEISVSRRFEEILGFAEGEYGTSGDTWKKSIHPDDISHALASLQTYLESKETSYSSEYRLRCKDGTYKWVLSRGMVVNRDAEGKPLNLLGTLSDIADRKQQEDKLRLAASVYENSSEGMLITDADTKIIAINPAFTDLTGYIIDEVIGKTPKILQSGRQSKEFYKEMWSQLKNIGQWQGELWNRRKDGGVYAERLHINAEINADGSIHRYIALFSDITDKKEKEELIWKQASFDSLTGLPNRRLFHDRLEQETKLSLRTGAPLGLLFIDLDRFKEVNDTLGHAKGDALLIEATKRIRSCVRETDTVARLGGDEFTVIIPDYSEAINLDRIVQNILKELTLSFDLGDGDIGHISASIGITLFPEDTNKLDELMQYADQAMYEAKLSGRNRSNYFKSSMQANAIEKMSLTNDLREALANKELTVVYQPIVDSNTGKINKAEALLRWNHPRRGLVSPSAFIPLAEESGLILEIGEWVFLEVIDTIEFWEQEAGQLIQVSVNKSPVQFVRAERHPWMDRLAISSLPKGCITVEITEGLLITDSDKVRDELISFQQLGIEVSIDDFGTGFSSLSYLNQFDIDYLKIDISFIKNITENESNRALTEAIIVMAHKLGIKTIAEGVETPEQRDLLIQFECDYIQGFLYSKPVSAGEFLKLLRRA